jgi:hypothetical protein
VYGIWPEIEKEAEGFDPQPRKNGRGVEGVLCMRKLRRPTQMVFGGLRLGDAGQPLETSLWQQVGACWLEK